VRNSGSLELEEDAGSALDPNALSSFPDAKIFAFGASGLTDFISSAEAIAVGDLSSSEEGVAALRGESAAIAVQQTKARAVRIKDHLSCCRPGDGSWISATPATLLY